MNKKFYPPIALLTLLLSAACQPQDGTGTPAAASSVPAQASAASASAAGNPAESGFKADAQVLLKKLDEIGAKSSARLNTDDMNRKMGAYAKAARDKKGALAKEISESELAVYREALGEIKAVKVDDKEVAGLRDLWARKFETDIKLLEGRIAAIDKGVPEKDWLAATFDTKSADENEKLAAEASEKTLEFGRRAR